MVENKIKDGWVVTLDYTLRDESGEIMESSEREGASMMYLHGGQEMPAGFQEQMADHSMGESFTFVLTPDQGWGDRSEEAVVEVPGEELDLDVEAGDIVEAEDDDGDMVELEVVEVREDGSVLLDGNHPLAGHTVTWEVEVTDLREGTKEEIEAGEVESPDEDEFLDEDEN